MSRQRPGPLGEKRSNNQGFDLAKADVGDILRVLSTGIPRIYRDIFDGLEVSPADQKDLDFADKRIADLANELYARLHIQPKMTGRPHTGM